MAESQNFTEVVFLPDPEDISIEKVRDDPKKIRDIMFRYSINVSQLKFQQNKNLHFDDFNIKCQLFFPFGVLSLLTMYVLIMLNTGSEHRTE
jgi:hypothetical protein